MKIHSSKSFKWKGGRGEANYSDVEISTGNSTIGSNGFRVVSERTGTIVNFSFQDVKYWQPMGSDDMFEILGYVFKADDIESTIFLHDKHVNGKPVK